MKTGTKTTVLKLQFNFVNTPWYNLGIVIWISTLYTFLFTFPQAIHLFYTYEHTLGIDIQVSFFKPYRLDSRDQVFKGPFRDP